LGVFLPHLKQNRLRRSRSGFSVGVNPRCQIFVTGTFHINLPMSYHNYRHFRGTVLRSAITVGLGSQLIAVPVLWAQTAGAAQTMDRVQITGSLIPTADTVGVAPVETVDAERITLTGQQDILAVLRRYSTSFAGSGNAGQTENNGGFGEANVALRNLSTLILLDGRRLASSAFSNGAAVDVNTLPLAMIDRIEILKDGSSTIYGSDAVGGVVNIITKKNWNGFEVGTRYGFATGNGYFNETQAMPSTATPRMGSALPRASTITSRTLSIPRTASPPRWGGRS